MAGDLVNRGPRSLDVLRWAREQRARLGGRFQVVLGNHDLHLVGRVLGARPEKRGDTLEDVLEAPDGPALVRWLRRRPLLHRESRRGAELVLVHAGLHPAWSTGQAEGLARRVGERLASPDARAFLARPADGALAWTRRLGREGRLRAALYAFTLMRTCSKAGRPCRGFSGPPREAPHGCLPWFAVPGRRSARATIVFGHWAALGLTLAPGLVALDSGCVWGGRLSAVRLEDRAVFQEPCAD